MKVAGNVPLKRKDTTAWHMSGEPESDGYLNLTCFKLPVNSVLERAHQYNTTLTIFLSALMMKCLLKFTGFLKKTEYTDAFLKKLQSI